MKKNVVALVGRPNVGKSTIFNRIVGKKISIIEDTPGITRDRIYSFARYKNFGFHLVDTGGIDSGNEVFSTEIKIQAELAIDEADVILFIVDGKEGLNSNDYVIKDMLKKANKKVILVINKTDSKSYVQNQYDFYELGFKKIFAVSGEQNTGFEDLLDEITKGFKDIEEKIDDKIRFSVIGRPNVGKSSLVNALLNEERVIVSEVPGTTRDAIDTEFTYNNQEFVVIDTAGMRKKGKIYESVERYSLLRSLKAIDRSDVCALLINASEGIIEHDTHIAGYALEAGKPVIIVVNKWDLIEDKDETMKAFIENIRSDFKFMPYADIVFLSALTKKRIHTLIPSIIKSYENSRKQIKTSLLNNCLRESYELNLPPSYKGRRLKMYFISQSGVCPPTFNIQVNDKGLVHFSYERYIENKIRESFDFSGTPIKIQFKNKGEENY